jgi:hypothetical protein
MKVSNYTADFIRGGAAQKNRRFDDDILLPAHERDDRGWFAANHTRSHRLRPQLAGEQLPVDPDIVGAPGWKSWVVVRQLAPGILVRHPVGIEPKLAADASRIEAVVHALYDMLVDSHGGQMLRFDHLAKLARQYAAVGSA